MTAASALVRWQKKQKKALPGNRSAFFAAESLIQTGSRGRVEPAVAVPEPNTHGAGFTRPTNYGF